MITVIGKYRLTLSPDQLNEFDDAWGLQSYNIKSLLKENKVITDSIMNDIKTVEVIELKLLSSLKSDKLKGKRILQLFQQDLLPEIIILEE